MTETNTFEITGNESIDELQTMHVEATAEGASADVINAIVKAIIDAAVKSQAKENERTRIDNLKKAIAGHEYGAKAIEILISRNMTTELKDKLAPPDEAAKFLKIYDLKVANGGTRICVSEKELKKCQKLLDGGRTLESIKHDEVVEAKKDKDGNPVKSDDAPIGDGSDGKTDEPAATDKPQPSATDEV